MYTYTRENLPKKTIALSITLPWEDVQKQYDISFEAIRQDLTVEGFRKGKAPLDVAKKHISKEAVYDNVLRTLVPKIYSEIIEKEKLKPVLSPHLEVVEAKENETWKLSLKTAEAPVVTLGEYKKAVLDVKKELKANTIWTPGKDAEPTEAEKETQKRTLFQKTLEALVSQIHIEISDLIIQEDIDRRLTKLIDDVQKVGLSIDSYLQSKNITKEALQEQLKTEVTDTYKLEFALQKIADEEHIVVDDAEIEKLFSGIKNEKEREMARKNAYYYASVMRKQKVLDYLDSL